MLRAILLKVHIFANQIESYSTVHGLSSCIEIKLSVPLAAHTTVTMYTRRAVSFFLHFQVLLFFGLTSYPAESAYFNSPNQKLSNSVQVMALH